MPITPKASEIAVTLTFWGPDNGTFPGSTANTSLGTVAGTICFNSLKFAGGQDLKDFKCAQDIVSMMRVVGQAHKVSGQLNFKATNSFLKKFQAEGPLCRIVVTAQDSASVSADVTLDCKGIMRLPDIDFLGNPGTIDFEIEAYGTVPLLTLV